MEPPKFIPGGREIQSQLYKSIGDNYRKATCLHMQCFYTVPTSPSITTLDIDKLVKDSVLYQFLHPQQFSGNSSVGNFISLFPNPNVRC